MVRCGLEKAVNPLGRFPVLLRALRQAVKPTQFVT
jgi:hypothetical protein